VEAHIEDHEKRIVKIESWKNGNGAKGAEDRLQYLEERAQPDRCVGLIALKEYIEEEKTAREKRRKFRISDIANLIQFAMLIAALVALYKG